jgi:hypothetical protein
MSAPVYTAEEESVEAVEPLTVTLLSDSLIAVSALLAELAEVVNARHDQLMATASSREVERLNIRPAHPFL